MPSVAQIYKQYVNQRVAVTIAPNVEVAAICTDARICYGRCHALVQPVLGVGSFWVGLQAIRVVKTDWPKQENKPLVEVPPEPATTT